MKRIFAAGASMAALIGVSGALVACGNDGASEAPAASESVAPAAAAAVENIPAAKAGVAAATPAAPDAPAFAVIYPEATLVSPATLARGPSGPGGILEFTTQDQPDAVVAFYRSHAEASGLTTIASMNQGGASAYSAGDGASGAGKLLSVVAAPGKDGLTNVQMNWSAGR